MTLDSEFEKQTTELNSTDFRIIQISRGISKSWRNMECENVEIFCVDFLLERW